MSDDLRFRLKSKSDKPQQQKREPKKTDNSGSIFGIWEDQRRMQAEEDKMARELAATKKKAKELQKTLRKHKIGETKSEFRNKSKQVTKKTKVRLSKTKSQVFAHKKLTIGVAGSLVAVLVIFNVIGSNTDKTDTLGDNVDISSQILPKEKPDFPILYPGGKNEDDFDVVRNSPPGSAPSYVYVDRFVQGGDQFQVTQQEVPDSFDLEKTARDFQASNIIQIDDKKVYHGYSEKAATQSLMFVKDGKLVLIASPKQFTDDQWANYIISLQ